jgi:uncharacterized membrane protein (Fun14 family)
MPIESVTVILNLLIIGGISGFLVGYTAKKIPKILAIGLSALFFIISLLAALGILAINYEGLGELWSNLFSLQFLELLAAFFGYLPFVSSFATGFTIGMKG